MKDTNSFNKNNKRELTDKQLKKALFKRAQSFKGSYNHRAERFEVDENAGLSKEQVELRYSQGLFNVSDKRYSKSFKNIFVGNICTFFNLLCLIAMIALIYSNARITQYLFVLIFVANIVIGIVQEIRAKLQIDKLSVLSAAHVKVIRDGEKKKITSEELVVDDIVLLSMGNQVPADCTLLEGVVEVNESLLTGESVAVKKKAGDTLLAGSFISSGACKLKVDKVGKGTYVNSLTSQAKQYKRPNSEIMSSITMFIKGIGIAIIPIAIGMFLINWKKLGGGYELFDYETLFVADSAARLVLNQVVQKTSAVIVGMIPSGMMLLTSMALAVGVIRLAQKNTLVQDLYSLEMLARVNVLCLDKTGTITDGRMKVSSSVVMDNDLLAKIGKEVSFNEIMSSYLASQEDNNQTSIALGNYFGHDKKLLNERVVPFSSARKYSMVEFKNFGTVALGAPEFVFPKQSEKLERLANEFTMQGQRVLVVGYSEAGSKDESLPKDLKPLGIIALIDNVREDAIASIKWFNENDVEVKVISGDNPITVSEVAKRAGIKNADKFISLEGLTNLEVETVANEYTVFGRVTPEQKALLIKTIKLNGNSVAMTGDGVNDILALKEADCAISVASGADAARDVSHIVLMDNNFNSMPSVVYEGRRVINNIEKSASLYLMKTFLIAFLAVFCLLAGKSYFFTTDNMLLFELFISGLPSFFLSLQPNNKKVEGKFFSYVIAHSIPQAITMFICIMAVFASYNIPGIRDNIYPVENREAHYQAMMVLIMSLSAVVMLFRICSPFNILRASLFLTVLTICLCVFFIKTPDFALADFMFADYHTIIFNVAEVLLTTTILMAAFPISKYITAFCNKLRRSLDEEE